MKKLFTFLFAFSLATTVLADGGQSLLPSTASQVVIFGPIADSTTGAAETGLAPIDDTEFTVCQDGGSCGAKNDTTDATHAGNGSYIVTLDDTDTAATNNVCILTEITGTFPRKECYPIVASGFLDVRNGTDQLATTRDLGETENTTVSSVTSPTIWVLSAGAANDDAYTQGAAVFVHDAATAELCVTTVQNFDYATATLTVESACPYTVAATDEVRVFAWPSARAVQVIGDNVDTINTATGTTLPGRFDSVDSAISGVSDLIGSPSDLGSGSTLAYNLSDLNTLITALNDLDAAGIRAAVGMASADLDTQLAALPTAIEIRTEMDSNSTQLAAIVADTNEMQTDDIPGLIGALANLDAAGVRTAIGLASANLDTQLAALPTAAENRAEMDSNSTKLGLLAGTFLNCEVNTANFAGDTTHFACILTDLDGSPVTQASGDLEGLQAVVTSGAQIREGRFINDTTWDAGNSELQIQVARALPGTLADEVTVVIR